MSELMCAYYLTFYRPYMVDGYNFGDYQVASVYKTSSADSLDCGFIPTFPKSL